MTTALEDSEAVLSRLGGVDPLDNLKWASDTPELVVSPAADGFSATLT